MKIDAGGIMGGDAAAALKINQHGKDVRRIAEAELARFKTGEQGEDLAVVARHFEDEHPGYNLPDEAYLDYLRQDHAKIDEITSGIPASQDKVNIIATDSEGGYTRMLLVRDPDGKFREVYKGVDKSSKEKDHIKDHDMFLMVKRG